MSKVLVVVLSTLAAFAGPAFAGDPAPTVSPATQTPPAAAVDSAAKAKADAKPKIVCTDEQVVGSRMRKRVCKTVDRIDEDTYHSSEALRQMTIGNGLMAPSGGAGN